MGVDSVVLHVHPNTLETQEVLESTGRVLPNVPEHSGRFVTWSAKTYDMGSMTWLSVCSFQISSHLFSLSL